MPRDSKVYLEDILEAIARIHRYTSGLSREAFAGDERTLDAVVRNLEVIGEAVKQLPADVRSHAPAVEWQRIAGLRDILIHQYFFLVRSRGTRAGPPTKRSSPEQMSSAALLRARGTAPLACLHARAKVPTDLDTDRARLGEVVRRFLHFIGFNGVTCYMLDIGFGL